MSARSQISIPELLAISDKIGGRVFASNDIYALLVLALVTVTKYSREKHRLSTQTRIELSIDFLPDLIQHLVGRKIMTKSVGRQLKQECKDREAELPSILEAYIYVSVGLRRKIDQQSTVIKNKSRCVIM